MDLIVEPEAEDDLKQFNEEHQQYILDRLQELGKKRLRVIKILTLSEFKVGRYSNM